MVNMYLELLYKNLKQYYNINSRDGIHVTDITLCPRKTIAREVFKWPITNKELNFFTSGRAIHDSIQILANMEKDRFEIEKPIEFEGVTGHVDLYDKVNNIPIECKSHRSAKIEKPKSFHIMQLKSYMAILGANKGILLYQCLLNFEDKPFIEFEITMTDEEIKTHKNWLRAMKLDSKNARDKKDYKLAINIINDPNLNWLCNECPLKDECMGKGKYIPK